MMATLKQGFTYQTGNVVITEIGSFVEANVSYDTSIPVANTTVTVDTGVSNGMIYTYHLPVSIYYTDPNSNVATQVISATIGISPSANADDVVLSSFPQYFNL
jgi:hypothetical protein